MYPLTELIPDPGFRDLVRFKLIEYSGLRQCDLLEFFTVLNKTKYLFTELDKTKNVIKDTTIQIKERLSIALLKQTRKIYIREIFLVYFMVSI